jgi:hypothetical protein
LLFGGSSVGCMPGSGYPSGFLVECYWPGVREEDIASVADRARAMASDLRGEGRPVAFLGTILVPADETVFCLFEGLEQDVRGVSARAGLPFDRVLASVRIDGEERGGKQ